MSETCKRIIKYAFQEVGFNRIYSYHHSDNPASGKVMQKSGMTLYKTEYKEMGSSRLSGEYYYYEIKKDN